MYISIVHMFIRTISLVHSYSINIRLCYCVLNQFSMKSFHIMFIIQNGFFIHVEVHITAQVYMEKKVFDFMCNCVM